MWRELEEAGLEDVIQSAIAEGVIMQMVAITDRDATMMIPISSMTEEHLMREVRSIAQDGDHYKQVNLAQLQEQIREARTGFDRGMIIQRMHIIESMGPIECIINLPKFIRLCIELLDKGYALEDIFYDKPN